MYTELYATIMLYSILNLLPRIDAAVHNISCQCGNNLATMADITEEVEPFRILYPSTQRLYEHIRESDPITYVGILLSSNDYLGRPLNAMDVTKFYGCMAEEKFKYYPRFPDWMLNDNAVKLLPQPKDYGFTLFHPEINSRCTNLQRLIQLRCISIAAGSKYRHQEIAVELGKEDVLRLLDFITGLKKHPECGQSVICNLDLTGSGTRANSGDAICILHSLQRMQEFQEIYEKYSRSEYRAPDHVLDATVPYSRSLNTMNSPTWIPGRRLVVLPEVNVNRDYAEASPGNTLKSNQLELKGILERDNRMRKRLGSKIVTERNPSSEMRMTEPKALLKGRNRNSS